MGAEEMGNLMPVVSDVYEAWQEVENAVLNLQEVTERTRQFLSNTPPDKALDVQSQQAFETVLYLEGLTLEIGRTVDAAKSRIGNAPVKGRTTKKKRP